MRWTRALAVESTDFGLIASWRCSTNAGRLRLIQTTAFTACCSPPGQRTKAPSHDLPRILALFISTTSFKAKQLSQQRVSAKYAGGAASCCRSCEFDTATHLQLLHTASRSGNYQARAQARVLDCCKRFLPEMSTQLGPRSLPNE